MDYKNFSIARDLLYVSGAMMGITLGYILSLFRKNLSTRSRNRRLTLMLFSFSGVFAAFSGAVVVSLGEIFAARSLFLAAALCIPVFALAVYFPRAAAYPLILAGGLVVVWLGYAFLRFPPVAEGGSPLAYIYREGDNTYSVRLPDERLPSERLPDEPGGGGDSAAAEDGPAPDGNRVAAAAFYIRGIRPPLDIEGACISFHPWYPVIGGTNRGLITAIRRNDEVLYADPRPEKSILQTWPSPPGRAGISFQHIGGTVPLDTMPRGASLAVSFADGALSFQTSR